MSKKIKNFGLKDMPSTSFVIQSKKKSLINIWLGIATIFLGSLFPVIVSAQYDHIQNAFVISPAKHEIGLSAGESVIRNIYITNKFNYDTDFIINIEDVSGSNVPGEVIKYYGTGLGPYSIRNYIMVENDHIRVLAGKTKVVPMLISLPTKIKPGGLYGGIFVSQVKKSEMTGTNISSRAGSLIFLRVKGLTEERGEVIRFDLSSGVKILWTRSPVNWQVAFENKGNVYLNPYGLIEIKNWNGRVIDRLPIEPWFVFPDSLRTRLLAWNSLPLFGYFTATLVLNHGYSIPHATTMNYKFLIIPLPLIIGLVTLALLGFIIYQTIRKLKKWQI